MSLLGGSTLDLGGINLGFGGHQPWIWGASTLDLGGINLGFGGINLGFVLLFSDLFFWGVDFGASVLGFIEIRSVVP